MFWSPSSGWKRISRHGVFQKGVGLLRTDSRDNEGNRPRRAEARLAASSYSLKTENSCWKAGIRWLVGASLWLRWYRLPAMQKTWVRSLGWEDPLEEGRATHSRIPARGIPWMQDPGGLQSAGSQKSRTRLSDNRFRAAQAECRGEHFCLVCSQEACWWFPGGFCNCDERAPPASEGTLVLGSASVAVGRDSA